MELLKTSWPFDSDPNVTYDDLGYPILDRAVGADTLQRTFDKFFSDGVFSTSDFRISAASGLSVNIQPGMCIINGGMAGWWDEPKVVALSATAPQWLTHYAIFLRYDNNDDMRGIYLRIDASAAGASVPEPVSAANVTELRIGYVTVPANATDLSGATFHNEVGTMYAPVTTPLFDVNVTAVLEDLRERADAAYQAYYDLLISAVDGTTAGHLQEQINAHGERITELENQEIDPQALRNEMGLGDTLGALPIENGGFGGTTVAELRQLLGMVGNPVAKAYASGTSTLSGTSTYQHNTNVWQTLDNDELFSISSDGAYLVFKKSGLYLFPSSALSIKVLAFGDYTNAESYVCIFPARDTSTSGVGNTLSSYFSIASLNTVYNYPIGNKTASYVFLEKAGVKGIYIDAGSRICFATRYATQATVNGYLEIMMITDLDGISTTTSS